MSQQIKEASIDIVIDTCTDSGTCRVNALALVITDEQHRFGVMQREALVNKGRYPHTLVMSATPIPRTLASLFMATWT